MTHIRNPLEARRYAPGGTLHYRHGRATYEVLAPFAYEVGAPGSGVVLTVPAGFVTDFASVPARFRRWFPPNGPWAKAAVLHDWLYSVGGSWRAKLFADYAFREAMAALHVPLVDRFILWAAVAAGGWRGFGRVDSENAALIRQVRSGAQRRAAAAAARGGYSERF